MKKDSLYGKPIAVALLQAEVMRPVEEVLMCESIYQEDNNKEIEGI